MPGNLTLEALRDAVNLGNIDTVIAAQVDMQGRLKGKRFHAEYFLKHACEETHSCNYLLAVDVEMEPVPGFKTASWASGYGDYIMKPDLGTLRLLPWLDGTALVICDTLEHEGCSPVRVAPRNVLKSQLKRLEDMNLCAMMASELEFYVFRESYKEAQEKGFRNIHYHSPHNQDYDIFLSHNDEPLMRAIRNGLHGAGITVECSKGEAYAGQEEINVRYNDALRMADDHTITKNAIKEIAMDVGHAVTFMPKWNYKASGSSCHIHQSLWSKDGTSASFHDPKGQYGMSELMQSYLAGLLQYASEYTLFLAPNINSYKRFQVGTFAPTKAVWSLDNRTAGYRVCGANSKAVRVECRIGGSDLNPYLAFAAQIAAGLAGIKNNLKLEPEFKGDGYTAKGIREIPGTLREAIKYLDESSILREALGDDVVDHYVHSAKWEQLEYDRRVTDWEIQRGFERY